MLVKDYHWRSYLGIGLSNKLNSPVSDAKYTCGVFLQKNGSLGELGHWYVIFNWDMCFNSDLFKSGRGESSKPFANQIALSEIWKYWKRRNLDLTKIWKVSEVYYRRRLFLVKLQAIVNHLYQKLAFSQDLMILLTCQKP